MKSGVAIAAVLLLGIGPVALADSHSTDAARDILVTFENDGARAISGSFSAPYRNRKRYAIAADARRNADAIAEEYSLLEVDHWPIRSLDVYCFVYRVPEDADRERVIARLQADERIESVQPLQEFETGTSDEVEYDDTYAGFQHGLSIMGITAAHRHTLGQGVRIAIIDSHADVNHEDLQGRLARIEDFASPDRQSDAAHGTAVASVIGARANNAKGIVGVAPEAKMELFVSCWADAARGKAVCDSFSLAKSLDTLLDDPPDVLNMSLVGPYDPLLSRLLIALHRADTIVVAAGGPIAGAENLFPASLDSVIGVTSSSEGAPATAGQPQNLFAPGEQIMVAVPNDAYDYRSGSSLAAAHVSGVIALLLANSPDLSSGAVSNMLQRSQAAKFTGARSINACIALQLADPTTICIDVAISSSKLESGAKDDT